MTAIYHRQLFAISISIYECNLLSIQGILNSDRIGNALNEKIKKKNKKELKNRLYCFSW